MHVYFVRKHLMPKKNSKYVIDFIQLNIQFHIEQEYGEALVQLDKRLTEYQISKRNCLSYLHRGHQLRKLLIALL